MKPLISATGLAEWLGVPLQTIYVWNHRKTGPKFVKVGRHVRYRPADVEEWLARHESEAV